jgi:type IV pilus assembly protein PilW
VEVLVTLALGGLVAAAALSITFSSRDLYANDRARIDLNQNLRSGLDLLGIDLRQAGERLPLDFPAIEIVDGGGTDPDTLIVRRNLLDAVLPVCEQIDAGASVGEIRVADGGAAPPAGCTPVADDDGDGWPDNIGEWRAHREARGGTVAVYLFNPVTGAGEFVRYDGDGSTSDFLSADADSGWQHDYLATQQCRAYMLEEHTYRLDAGLLQYLLDGDAANPFNLVHDMTDFQVRAVLTDGTLRDSFSAADDWSDLATVEITLTGRTTDRSSPDTKTVTTRFFPRNILSL